MASPCPNFHWAKVTCRDANSTFNETSMQVTCLHITVLAVSKHVAYCLVCFMLSTSGLWC